SGALSVDNLPASRRAASTPRGAGRWSAETPDVALPDCRLLHLQPLSARLEAPADCIVGRRGGVDCECHVFCANETNCARLVLTHRLTDPYSARARDIGKLSNRGGASRVLARFGSAGGRE